MSGLAKHKKGQTQAWPIPSVPIEHAGITSRHQHRCRSHESRPIAGLDISGVTCGIELFTPSVASIVSELPWHGLSALVMPDHVSGHDLACYHV